MNLSITGEAIQSGLNGSLPTLDFKLPPDLEAGLPPEERGLRRDQVRLMVSHRRQTEVVHSRFDRLAEFLNAGDVLVINTSATLKAALQARQQDGMELELHLSTHLPGNRWVVELRHTAEDGALPFYSAKAGEKLSLPGRGKAVLYSPYPGEMQRNRLWIASLELPMPVNSYLERYGFPIRYKYVHTGWPIEYYQNVYAIEPGSAEMPSAGRAFTADLITRLVAQGVHFAPLLLHTGVASLEENEKPYEEFFRVPATTAQLINFARSERGRVIAVGTTVVRALRTVTGEDGTVHPGEGWTDLVVTPETELRSIDGLLTGLHEPRSTHLSMLFAFAGRERISQAYQQALKHKYLWHEFGDLHMILP
jgi:S-adenosylmethionine:tRNA ribosyltransferase-isomerase